MPQKDRNGIPDMEVPFTREGKTRRSAMFLGFFGPWTAFQLIDCNFRKE